LGDAFRSPIRARNQAASKAYRPELISLTAISSSVASFFSTIRSTMPASSRITRPRLPGSMASTATRAIAAWSIRRSSSSSSRRSASSSGASPVRTRISSASSGIAASADATASPVPRGSAWRA
jgi:hypothetical protein